jgi:hypothetical protein
MQALVHLVGQHPDAGAGAVRQNVGLLGAAERPAYGIVGRVDDQHPLDWGDGGFERRHVTVCLWYLLIDQWLHRVFMGDTASLHAKESGATSSVCVSHSALRLSAGHSSAYRICL